MKMRDLTGMRFGMLTVEYRAPNRTAPCGKSQVVWHCVCDCGNEKDIPAGLLTTGTKSCGCIAHRPQTWKGAEIRERPKPQPVKLPELRVGRIYRINGQSLKLIGLYDAFARFEDEHGFHECYLYWDLGRALK